MSAVRVVQTACAVNPSLDNLAGELRAFGAELRDLIKQIETLEGLCAELEDRFDTIRSTVTAAA
jgi:prefoldin subunit 5